MNEEENKINIINKILSNQSNFEEYLETISNNTTKIPKNLNKNIIISIKVFDSIKRNKTQYRFTDILKVACFAFVTVLFWELCISRISNIDYLKLQEKTQVISLSNNNNTITNKLSGFMMSEIIKGGEKN